MRVPRITKEVVAALGGPRPDIGDLFIRTGKAVYQDKRFIVIGRRGLWWKCLRFNFKLGFDYCHGDCRLSSDGDLQSFQWIEKKVERKPNTRIEIISERNTFP